MLTRSKTAALAFFALLVCSIAVAHTDGIYNPSANSVGNFEGIDSNGAAAVVTAATWNPSDKGASITLSNGNLTVVGTAAQSVRSTSGRSTGKYYFEVTIDLLAGDSQSNGLANATFDPTSTYIGNANSAGVFFQSGSILVANTTVLTIPGIAQGHTAGFAIDLGNGKLWVRDGAAGNWNNDVIANQNPATNTGGVNISSIISGTMKLGATVSSASNQQTTNFGATSFIGTPPSGFGNL